MRLINKSRWDTGDLLKFLRECFKRAGSDIRDYTIEIGNTSSSGIRGLGSYTRCWLKLRIPKQSKVSIIGLNGTAAIEFRDAVNTVELAQVAIHEVGHTQGLHHRDMISYKEIDASWAKDSVIRPKQLKARPTMDEIIRKRYEKIRANIKRKETRMKRLKTSLKKLHNRRKYYERKLR